MTREQALNVVKANVEDKALVRQILAAEEIMRALARRLGEDEDEWGLAGLLYDVDVELVQDDPSSHGRLSADIAGDLGAPATVVHAILCQGVDHSIAPETSLDKALYCVDPLCRLIMSVASLYSRRPTSSEVIWRFRDKGFSPQINRQQLAICKELGLDLEEFISMGVVAAQNVIS